MRRQVHGLVLRLAGAVRRSGTICAANWPGSLAEATGCRRTVAHMGALVKKARTAEQLRAMVQLRIDDLPSVRKRARDRMSMPVAGLPWRWGNSWSLLVSKIADDVDRDAETIVSLMRLEYDLAE